MAPQKNDIIVWLDMEMTGLDPECCVPIQVAMVITSSELKELDSMEITIWQPEARLSTMEPIVRNMHTENGLVKQVQKSQTSVGEAEQALLQCLARWCKPREGVLAGNSIHQDRRFLRKYFPSIDGYLHYRMIDVSTLKELAKRWYGPEVLYAKGTNQHTALADTRESIAELAHYRETMLRTKGAAQS